MGNSSSSSGRGHHDDTVDYGSLVSQGVYTGPKDWNQSIVSQLICARKLAPFYRPLEDYDESWDDDRILAARKELPDPEAAQDQPSRIEASASVKSSTSSKRPALQKDVPPKAEAAIYRGAVECPICFLVSRLSIDARCSLSITSHRPVLSPQHQPFPLLRPPHLHRMLCPDKA